MTDIEASARREVRLRLDQDFHVFEGYSGIHKHGGERVKYDIVLRAKPHLVEAGFDEGFAIVEVKLFNLDDRKKHDVKARDLLWQSVAYSFSDICLPDGTTQRPLFVLYFLSGTGVDPKHTAEFQTLHHFVQRGGVGRLELSQKRGWSMIFGGSNYFREFAGKGPHHVGTKRQTGSSR